jgi:hypothetical protein
MHSVTTTIHANSDILGFVISHTSLSGDNAPSLTIEVVGIQLKLSEGSGLNLANALRAPQLLGVSENNLWILSVGSVSGRSQQSAQDFWIRHSSEATDVFRFVIVHSGSWSTPIFAETR